MTKIENRFFEQLVSPFIYFLCQVPVFIAGLAFAIYQESTSYFLFNQTGEVEFAIAIILVGLPLFWFASRLLMRIDGIVRPSIWSHLRQSSVFYVASVVTIMYLTRYGGTQDGLWEGYVTVQTVIGLWGIIVNAAYTIITRLKPYLSFKKSVSLQICKEYLGKEVRIVIDQAYGTEYEGAVYEQNYGYVPDTQAPDGDELDAYFIGPQEPITEATGECIAIIHRYHDDDDKLVLVPHGVSMTDEEIEAAVHFREHLFEHCIVRR